MATRWRSRTGWTLVGVYLLLAIWAWYEAFTCSGWVCDLTALPAIFPLAFPIAWLTDWIHAIVFIPGHVPSFHLRNWYFIAPTVVGNSVFYYCLGYLLGGLVNRLRRSRQNRGS